MSSFFLSPLLVPFLVSLFLFPFLVLSPTHIPQPHTHPASPSASPLVITFRHRHQSSPTVIAFSYRLQSSPSGSILRFSIPLTPLHPMRKPLLGSRLPFLIHCALSAGLPGSILGFSIPFAPLQPLLKPLSGSKPAFLSPQTLSGAACSCCRSGAGEAYTGAPPQTPAPLKPFPTLLRKVTGRGGPLMRTSRSQGSSAAMRKPTLLSLRDRLMPFYWGSTPNPGATRSHLAGQPAFAPQPPEGGGGARFKRGAPRPSPLSNR